MDKDMERRGEPEQPFLVRFFDPKVAAKDFRGRTLDDILAYDDDRFEMSHDYIQILFPLPEGSAFNWQSPIIDKDTFQAFRAREDLRKSFQRGYIRIMNFYGFDVTLLDAGGVQLSRSANHKIAFRNWVVRMDHNHLRISRIIRSLRVLGLTARADAFYKAILEVNTDFPNRISARSLMYWKRAAERPLYLSPDQDDDDVVTGPRFLLDFEKNNGD
ncbi:hypothetical protein, variant [Verruconis gallopava]|uniref:Opioid growth factor receptor (OGFr) conserved domain-containing protein n=1 Tax=Verruconis gallopava TaxID=253628 RepID=A0A0D1XDE3_9PEZI|nr:uncharacterized protein PV09_08147 [Verruconis gallopava]XP_016210126.1 hypothetical protein, variant [Verruconis gallopava]KIW00256.1 hypothetical protein PV09_08147 [Verruconis gallopava]KIW00257.1 hypothetical protein, variant [Verruconis gallopava]